MIYMVEMAFTARGVRAKWDDWYFSHMQMLITIPGIRASQRFEAQHDCLQPFVALHDVTGPEVFTSDAYKAKAGPASTGEWGALNKNWGRNVYSGMEHTPDVGEDAFLMIAESGYEGIFPPSLELHSLRSVGLDRNPLRRVLAVTDQPSVAMPIIGQKGVRVLKPLSPRIVAEQV